jgi:hypothetical protein
VCASSRPPHASNHNAYNDDAMMYHVACNSAATSGDVVTVDRDAGNAFDVNVSNPTSHNEPTKGKFNQKLSQEAVMETKTVKRKGNTGQGMQHEHQTCYSMYGNSNKFIARCHSQHPLSTLPQSNDRGEVHDSENRHDSPCPRTEILFGPNFLAHA